MGGTIGAGAGTGAGTVVFFSSALMTFSILSSLPSICLMDDCSTAAAAAADEACAAASCAAAAVACAALKSSPMLPLLPRCG